MAERMNRSFASVYARRSHGDALRRLAPRRSVRARAMRDAGIAERRWRIASGQRQRSMTNGATSSAAPTMLSHHQLSMK